MTEKNDESTDQVKLGSPEQNVYIYEQGIIYYKELHIATPESVLLFFSRVFELGKQFDNYGILIDLRDAKVPDAVTRRTINDEFSKLCDEASHVSFVTGKNILINTAAKFVMFQTDLNSYTVNKNIEDGITAIKKIINIDHT